MAKLSEIEMDVMDFLNKVDDLSVDDRKEFLMLIMKKHLLLMQSPVMLSYEDLMLTVSNAKSIFAQVPMPIKLVDRLNSNQELTTQECSHYCMVEAVISLLNSKEALLKVPSFKKKYQ